MLINKPKFLNFYNNLNIQKQIIISKFYYYSQNKKKIMHNASFKNLAKFVKQMLYKSIFWHFDQFYISLLI